MKHNKDGNMNKNSPPVNQYRKKHTINLWLIAVALCVASFSIAWFVKGSLDEITPPQPLRSGGYQFIDPLLSCNISGSRIFPEDKTLNGGIQSVIDAHVQSGDLSKASAYFVDLANGKWSDTYPDGEYYPSSLGKIPIMMAYYEMAESDPSILTKEIAYTGGTNLNQTQDITPPKRLFPAKPTP